MIPGSSSIYISIAKDILYRHLVCMDTLAQLQGVSLELPLSSVLVVLSRFSEQFTAHQILPGSSGVCDVPYPWSKSAEDKNPFFFSWDSIPSIHRISLRRIKINFLPQDSVQRAWIYVTFYNVEFYVPLQTSKSFQTPCMV